MRINPINNQAFTGNYLLKFRDGHAGFEAFSKMWTMRKDGSAIQCGSDVLLLTGSDYYAFNRMTKLYMGNDPLLSGYEAEKKILESIKKDSTVIDLRDDKYYVEERKK